MNNTTRIINEIAALPGARFVGLNYTAKGTGEVARHVIICGFSYGRALRVSIEGANAFVPATPLQEQAKAKVLASLLKSKEANAKNTVSADYTCKDVYSAVKVVNGTVIYCAFDDRDAISGVRVHKETGAIQFSGLAHRKIVEVAGVYKPDNRLPLTREQDAIKAGLPVSKYRSFVVEPEHLASVRVSGVELEP